MPVSQHIPERGFIIITDLLLGLGLDATDEKQVQSAFTRVKKEFGRLDILVNNVGRGTGRGSPRIEERAKADWDLTLKNNLDPMFLCTRGAMPIMIKQRSGSIINIASVSGMVGRDNRLVVQCRHAIIAAIRPKTLFVQHNGNTWHSHRQRVRKRRLYFGKFKERYHGRIS